jgi:hypothetical protein
MSQTAEERRAYHRRWRAAHREHTRLYDREYRRRLSRGEGPERQRGPVGDGITRCQLCAIRRQPGDWTEGGLCLDCARRKGRCPGSAA